GEEKPSLGYVYEGMQRAKNVIKEMYHKKPSYDLIDYECIDQVEFWVAKEEVHGELDIDELENDLYHFNGFLICIIPVMKNIESSVFHYEYIDQVEFWVAEEEVHGELDIDELENDMYHFNGFPIYIILSN
ncbi:unnamed protein product, partial [Sphenostylis stenocarpa]